MCGSEFAECEDQKHEFKTLWIQCRVCNVTILETQAQDGLCKYCYAVREADETL